VFRPIRSRNWWPSACRGFRHRSGLLEQALTELSVRHISRNRVVSNSSRLLSLGPCRADPAGAGSAWPGQAPALHRLSRPRPGHYVASAGSVLISLTTVPSPSCHSERSEESRLDSCLYAPKPERDSSLRSE
jgi:hypothetical protein